MTWWWLGERGVGYTRPMNTPHNSSQGRGEPVSAPKTTQIKLGLEVHANSIVVVRPLDGQNPQPPQKFAPAKFLDWVRPQLPLAGVFGVCNVVVAPQHLDERHTGVKTDKTDARARSRPWEGEHPARFVDGVRSWSA